MKKIIERIRSWLKPFENQGVTKSRFSRLENMGSKGNHQKARDLRLIDRAEKDVLNGQVQKAISRYEGFFEQFPSNQSIHFKVAELYFQIGDKKRAGRHVFFKESLSNWEKDCVNEFQKACGNSPTIILKKLIAKQNFRISELDKHTKMKLKILIEEAVMECGTTPNFLKAARAHLDKLDHAAE